MAFSFKHVGTRVVDKTTQLAVTVKPIGIKTPMRLGDSREGIFGMHYSMADQLHDNLRNMLLTNWGERLGMYDFGANLRPLMSEMVADEDFADEAMNRVRKACAKWMPYVDLETFDMTSAAETHTGLAVKQLTIIYNVASLNIKERALRLILRAM